MDSTLRHTGAEASRLARLVALQARFRRAAVWSLLGAAALFPLLWVLFLAPTTGGGATTFGSAVHDPKDFLITLLNGLTAAGLYFVVASGFTLIFGLMRVVNMAHGAFFLFGGYIALKLQRDFVGGGGVVAMKRTYASANAIAPTMTTRGARCMIRRARSMRSACPRTVAT